MRPLLLSIENVRSYRERTEIDFSDKSLMAIVGDTGAGKSSILHAIAAALYNVTFWDERGIKSLIAAGQNTMTLSLLFSADDRQWRVTRSTSRTTSPPPAHVLVCEDDPTLSFSGEAPVKAQIVKLLGMDFAAFQAAVLLPQGDFAQLLNAKPATRADIIKGVFRLDDLSRLRSQIDVLCVRAEAVWARLDEARRRLPQDPRALAADYRRKVDEANLHVGKVETLLASVRELAVDRAAVRGRLGQVDGALKLLTRLGRSATSTLESIVAASVEIEQVLSELAPQHDALARHESELNERTKAAHDVGESVERLTAAEQTVKLVQSRIDATLTRRATMDIERVELGRRAGDLQKSDKNLAKLKQANEQGAGTLAGAEAAVNAAEERYITARSTLRDARMSEMATRHAQTVIEQQTSKVAATSEALKLSEKRYSDATTTVARARANLEVGQKQHAAAHAATGLHAGDKCPICQSSLPKAFRPPGHAPLEPLVESLNAAEKVAAADQQARIKAEADHRTEAARLEQVAADLESAALTLKDRWAALGAVLQVVDPAKSDDELLEPLVKDGAKLRTTCDSTRAAAGAAQQTYLSELARIDSERTALNNAKRQVEMATQQLDHEVDECKGQLKTLPAFITLPEDLTTQALDPLAKAITHHLQQAVELKQSLDTTVMHLRTVEGEMARMHDRRSYEVDVPRRRSEALLLELLPRLNDCRKLLTPAFRELLKPDEGISLAELISHAREAEKCADEVLQSGREETDALARRIAELEMSSAKQLTDAGFADLRNAELAHSGALQELGASKRSLEEAEKLVPLVDSLDADLQRAADTRGSMAELKRLLPGFETYVTTRRTRDLLAVASTIFQRMTAGRYGFSEDFQIFDLQNGVPRSTRTLSGGETFLASLALALGLVEIAARAGGKLDSLFLDEGFGSLDPDALDEALTALDERARAGRLVVLVSHIGAVAEHDGIQDVLEVRRAPTGSVLRWLSRGESDETLEEELRGLLPRS